MERIKRRQNNAIHDFHNNKKRKLQDKTTTIDIKKFHITRFEDLSNEVVYEIFEFLDTYHIYEAFFNLNERFQHLLFNSTLPIQINISTISKSNFERYHRDMIIPNKHRIEFLHLSNPFTVDIIFSPPRSILKFLRLETLHLDHIKSKYLENILNHLMFLPKLHSLIIHPADYIQHPTLFFIQIFRLPKLKFCKITFETKDDRESLFISTGELSPIEHLIINARFSIDAFDNLLSYVPRLHHLSINRLVESRYPKRELSPIKLKHLEYLSLVVDFIYFNQFEILIKYFFQHIQVLRISTKYDVAYLDAKRWEQLILSYMPNLRIFDINHDATAQIRFTDNELTFHELINQFNSPFWIERKWFFSHQHCFQETLNSGIFYSIGPHRKKEYKFYWESDEQVCSYIQETNSNLIKQVDVCSKQITHTRVNYFPNATELIVRHRFNTLDNSMATTLNRIVPFTRLSKLVIECFNFPFEQLVKLLCFTPHLYALKFGPISFAQSNLILIQQSDSFQYVSNMNRIKNLDLHESCTLDYILMILNLFPRLEYLKTGMNRKEIEPIGRFLFSKINNKTYQLFFLCIAYTPKIHLQKLKILIKLEKLLDDYFINFVNHDLYLWW